MPTLRKIRLVYKPLVFAAALAPLAWLAASVFGAFGLSAGANPVETIQDTTGIWAVRMLLLTLAITPLRRLTGQGWLIQFRRMLGLFAFAYAVLHFLNYLALDQTLDVEAIIEDIVERPFITVGFAAFVLLTPLAVTSTNGWRRKLGARWQQLHYLVYPIAMLACWHFYWQVKKDLREPLIYIAILAMLLCLRLFHRYRQAGRFPA